MYVFVSYSMRDDVAILLPDGHIKVHRSKFRGFLEISFSLRFRSQN